MPVIANKSALAGLSEGRFHPAGGTIGPWSLLLPAMTWPQLSKLDVGEVAYLYIYTDILVKIIVVGQSGCSFRGWISKSTLSWQLPAFALF